MSCKAKGSFASTSIKHSGQRAVENTYCASRSGLECAGALTSKSPGLQATQVCFSLLLHLHPPFSEPRWAKVLPHGCSQEGTVRSGWTFHLSGQRWHFCFSIYHLLKQITWPHQTSRVWGSARKDEWVEQHLHIPHPLIRQVKQDFWLWSSWALNTCGKVNLETT